MVAEEVARQRIPFVELSYVASAVEENDVAPVVTAKRHFRLVATPFSPLPRMVTSVAPSRGPRLGLTLDTTAAS
jgi:hypothetical protein